MSSSPNEVTRLLLQWSEGNQAALEQLLPLVYAELRRIARRYLARERRGHTLQTTALINEAYLRLVDQQNVQWQNRAHFFGAAAQVMRHILIDHARSYQYEKRGAGAQKVPLDEAAVFTGQRASELIALDDALSTLGQVDPRKSQLVELRFFGGLSVEETAEVMKISVATVMREWRATKAWLRHAMKKEGLPEIL